MMSQSDVDAITISMLVKSRRKNVESPEICRPTPEDQKFYRKRIVRILKGMLNGTIECSRLQELHDSYVNGVIDYLKANDLNDAMQARYSALPSTARLKKTAPKPYRDEVIHPKEEATLSKFVKIKPRQPPAFPRTKPPFLKTEANRIKTDTFNK